MNTDRPQFFSRWVLHGYWILRRNICMPRSSSIRVMSSFEVHVCANFSLSRSLAFSASLALLAPSCTSNFLKVDFCRMLLLRFLKSTWGRWSTYWASVGVKCWICQLPGMMNVVFYAVFCGENTLTKPFFLLCLTRSSRW